MRSDCLKSFGISGDGKDQYNGGYFKNGDFCRAKVSFGIFFENLEGISDLQHDESLPRSKISAQLATLNRSFLGLS